MNKSTEIKRVEGVIHHHIRNQEPLLDKEGNCIWDADGKTYKVKNNPIGILVASHEKINGEDIIHIGWAKWHLDSSMPWLIYDEQKGYNKAVNRMRNHAPMPKRDFVIPANDLQVILDRAVKYFKIESVQA